MRFLRAALLGFLLVPLTTRCSTLPLLHRADFSSLPIFVKRLEPTAGAMNIQPINIGMTFYAPSNAEFGGRETVTMMIEERQSPDDRYGVAVHELMHTQDPGSGESHGLGRGCYGRTPLQNHHREPLCPEDVGFFRRMRQVTRDVYLRPQDAVWIREPVEKAIEAANAAAGRALFRLRP